MPQLQSAIGLTWYDMNLFDKARGALLRAVQAEDLAGQVPIKDIERLANVEARLGERLGTLKAGTRSAGAKPGAESGEALIRLALERLAGLDNLVSARIDTGSPVAPLVNAERSSLRASALKRLAGLIARHLVEGTLNGSERQDRQREMLEALTGSAEAYRLAERVPDSGEYSPHQALNRLALEALIAPDGGRDAAIEVARQCARAAQKIAHADEPWEEIMQPEALLVERLLDGRLAEAGEAGDGALAELQRAYDESLTNVVMKPAQIDSMASQMALLARFARALALGEAGKPRQAMLGRLADRLLDLLEHLQPGHRMRGDRLLADESAKSAAVNQARPTPPRASRKRASARTSRRTPHR